MSKKKLFDSKCKTLSDRIGHVEKISDSSCLSKKDLNKLGTYILESKGIESSRKLENPFFITYSQAKMWKEYSSCSLNESDVSKKSMNNIIDRDNELSTTWIGKLFNLGRLTPDEQIKLIKSYHQFRDSDIQEQLLEHLYFSLQVIFNRVRDGVDLVILNLLAYNNTQSDISKKILIEQSNISRRLKRITESF